MRLFTSEDYIKHFCVCQNNFFPFDLEKNRWVYTDDLRTSEIVPLHFRVYGGEIEEQYENLLQLGYSDQWLLILDIFHMDENSSDPYHYQDALKFYKDKNIEKIIIVSTNSAFTYDNIPYLYYDHMFNRQKAYMTTFDESLIKDRIYSYTASKTCYELDDIKHNFNSDKIYLCPNRIYDWDHQRFYYRKELRDYLKSFTDIQGYISDPTNNIILEPQEQSLLKFMEDSDYGGGGTWFPIKNTYYQDTWFSVYVESISTNKDDTIFKLYDYNGLTEKTFDPLIKGHFILPFGYQGLIADIQKYGFMLPNFIDYSYDSITNNQDRFSAFLQSLKKLLSFTPEYWTTLYNKNITMLKHNRQLFYDRSYDSLYDKVLKHIDKINSVTGENYDGRTNTRI